ncbi:MAG: alpha/beta hydrolase [Anaerolineae bacterium]|nr:alpha/beta hydrolase [Anaerolineae bacterium]
MVSVITLVFAVFVPTGAWVSAQETTSSGNYASVNGLELYYETYGEGDPLILLHGGLGGIVDFSLLLPLLAETRQVIAVELQGHGHTGDIDRPISYELMADDIAALIEYLGFENADVLGFSLGGGVALQTAIRHPEVVRKLILISTPFQRAGIHAEFLMGMDAMSAEGADQMVGLPMHDFYLNTSPNPEAWSTVVGKVGALLQQDYDWSADVANITLPTLIIVGDADMPYPAHALEMFSLLGGGVAGDFAGLPASQFAMLPGTTHFSILTRTDLLLPVIIPFLDAAMPE